MNHQPERPSGADLANFEPHLSGASALAPCCCSHGFCLFNNAAIGAAYAMNVYRHAGIRRVAIVDFDVHHGNGTGGQPAARSSHAAAACAA